MSEPEVARAIVRRVEQLGAADRFSGAVLVVKGDRILVSMAKGSGDKAFRGATRVDTKFNLGVAVLGNYDHPNARDLAAEIVEFLAVQDTK